MHERLGNNIDAFITRHRDDSTVGDDASSDAGGADDEADARRWIRHPRQLTARKQGPGRWLRAKTSARG
eukprot:5091664-Pyramimonas_sp.AAC.1